MTSLDTCTSSHSRVIAGLLTVLVSGLSACTLGSIDPDEIDVADDSTDGAADELGGTAAEASADIDDGEFDTGDASEGTSSEGTSEGTSSDTGGDTSDGDPSCEASHEVVLGENPVAIAAGTSNFQGSCGGTESETLYSFTVPADGDYEFSLIGAEFSPVLYVLLQDCVENASCSNTAEPVLESLSGGETVIVVVDSDGGVGSATLLITGL